MGIIATNENSGTNYTPVPSGSHVAICYQMIEIGTLREEFKGQIKDLKKVRIGWELPYETKVFKEGEEAKPYVINQEFTLSMYEKSTLRKFIDSWRGKKLSDDEAKAFDITVLLGKPCTISIVHTEKDGKVYANISGISSVPKGMQVPKQTNPTFVLSYDDFDFNKFESLPDFLKDKIKTTPEFQNVINHENHAINTNTNHFSDNSPEANDLPF